MSSCVLVQPDHYIENLLTSELEECIVSSFATDLNLEPVFYRKGALLECEINNLRYTIVQSNLNNWIGDILIEEFTIKVEVTIISCECKRSLTRNLCKHGLDYQYLECGSKLLFFTTIDLTKGWQGDELTSYLENFFRVFLPFNECQKVA